MSKKVVRDTRDVSVHWVTRGTMPEAMVPAATRMPSTSTSWLGLNGKRRTVRNYPRPLCVQGKRRAGSRLLRGLLVVLAQPVGEAAQQLVREARHLVDHGGELALAEDGELHVGLRRDGRVAGRPVQEGQVPEEGARPERGHGPPPAGDDGLPGDDHEELGSRGPLSDDD